MSEYFGIKAMYGADPRRDTSKAWAVQLPVADEILPEMNHFMRQTGQQCVGVPIAGLANPNKRRARFNAKVGG